MTTKNKTSKEAMRYLQSSKGKILGYLKEVVRSRDFSYRTFGTAIEEHLADVLVKIFTGGNFIKNGGDYTVAPNKNYFPDFELKTAPHIAIEFKSGNKSQHREEKWIRVKNSENDMGTLNEWPQKIAKFGGENIYFLFVIYNFNDKTEEVFDVVLAPFYQCIGLNSDRLLKYREKDGNLRPKDFGVEPPIKTLQQFEQLLNKTIVYRSKRIIKKHRLIIKKTSQDS